MWTFMKGHPTDIQARVRRAVEEYATLPAVVIEDGVSPDDLYLATPNRLGYAMGWIVAAEIVRARFNSSGIDVLPVFHPDRGWDRFLVSRRVTARAFNRFPADEFGVLFVRAGDEALRFVTRDKRRISLGARLVEDASPAILDVLTRIPGPRLEVDGKPALGRGEQAPDYPSAYDAIAELIAEYPGLVAAREVFIDDEQIDGQFHPLHLHAAELSSSGPDDREGANLPVLTYNWIQLQYGDLFAFVDRLGKRAIYRTDRGTWARARVPLGNAPVERVKERIARWLRLGGAVPDPEVD